VVLLHHREKCVVKVSHGMFDFCLVAVCDGEELLLVFPAGRFDFLPVRVCLWLEPRRWSLETVFEEVFEVVVEIPAEIPASDGMMSLGLLCFSGKEEVEGVGFEE
jgi:hypothetical protein